MAKKVTRKQIDSMIETCIKAVNKGIMLPKVQDNKFSVLFNRIRESRGVDYTIGTVHAFYSFGSPQGFLLDALTLGLITKTKHKNFIAKVKTLIEIEASLLFIGHLEPTKYLKFAHEQHSKPIEERLQNLGRISGVDFSELVNLYERKASVENRASHEKNKVRREQLRKEEKRLKRQLGQKEKVIVSLVKGRLAAKFTQPNYRQRFIAHLKNPKDMLPGRELDKLMKNLEAYNKWKAKQKLKTRRRHK